MTGDLGDKRLELLKEIIPKLSRVAVFRDLTNVNEGIGVDEIEPTARVLKLQTQRFELAKVEDFDSQFQAIMKWHPGGMMIVGGPLMNGHRKRIVEFAAKNKQQGRVCPSRRACQLRYKLYRLNPPRGDLCRQDSKGHKTRRYSSRATNKV